MVHTVAWAVLFFATVFLTIAALAQSAIAVRAAEAGGFVAVVGIVSLILNRTGRTALAAWLIVLGPVLAVGMLALDAGGVRSPGVLGYVTMVFMAGIVLGVRGGIITGIICALISLGLLVLELRGVLPERTVTYSPVALWALTCMYIMIALALQQLAARTVANALARARQKEQERERLVHELAERVKELRLLHWVTTLFASGRAFDAALMRDIVTRIPDAWQYPEICQARIAFRDEQSMTPAWRQTPWMQSAPIVTTAGAGSIDVAYTENRQDGSGDVFLKEERALLESLAELIAGHIDRSAANTAKTVLEDQLRQSQKMEALGRLAGGVAHDFNNLLTVIEGYCEFVIADLPRPSRGFDDVKEISSAARRAAQLTRQLLAFSRSQVLSPAIISPNEIITGMGSLLHRLIGSDIEFKLNLDPTVGTVLADAGQFEQVIMNLVVNARDAMPNGGSLTIQSATTELGDELRTERMSLKPGRYVTLSVADTGTGMTEDVKTRIFEPFFTTKESGRGTGLGLATVFGIVQQSGGGVWVYSEPGEGSVFNVYLPSASGDMMIRTAEHEVLSLNRGTESIVLVDDDEYVRVLAARALSAGGYRVVAFADGGAAVEYLQSAVTPPDMLITDVVMPRFRGPEVASRMRAKWPHSRVLYMTGYTDRAIEPGTPNVLQKPFTPSTLLKSVRELLDQNAAA